MLDASYSLDEECWEYLDPKGVKRGPFSGSRMLLWYESRMLPESLGVRHCSSMPFVPIQELFKSPFQPFKSRPRVGPCLWQYRDTKGQLQGPFPNAQMSQWYEHGMLPKSLQLRRITDPHFATIADYFPRPLVPFQSAPVQPTAMPQPLMGTGFAAAGGMQAGNASALGGISLDSGMATVAAAAAAANAAKAAAQAKAAAAYPKTNNAAKGLAQVQQAATAAAAAAAAAAVAAAQSAGKQQPKAKAEAKGKAAAKADAGHPPSADGKGKGKGKHQETAAGVVAKDKGRGKADGAKHHQQQHDGWESGDWWSAAGDKWWEWSAWNGGGWSGDCWEGNGKQQGAEWKGAKTGGGGESDGPAGSPPKDKAERGSAVQAAFGNLNWGPQTEAPDLFPEDTIRKVQDEGIVWEERWICPLLVRFSQGKIHPFFHGRGPISEVMLQIRLRAAEAGEALGGSGADVRRIDPPFPPIRLLHLKEQGVLVTLDNRRLYALQRFALQEWPTVCLARALCVDELTPTRLRAENRKFTNRLCGLQLEVESRSNAFDTFSWVTEAAHAEAPKFCRPIAFRALDKVLSLLPMLVVHALTSPKFRPILRSRWPLLRYLAAILPNPQRREFSGKRILLQHVLELPKPSRRTSTCPPLCIGYKAETVVTLSKGKSCVTSKLSVSRPLQLSQGSPLSDTQRRTLRATLPLFCLPYARSALRSDMRLWVEVFLLSWGKVAVSRMQLSA